MAVLKELWYLLGWIQTGNFSVSTVQPGKSRGRCRPQHKCDKLLQFPAGVTWEELSPEPRIWATDQASNSPTSSAHTETALAHSVRGHREPERYAGVQVGWELGQLSWEWGHQCQRGRAWGGHHYPWRQTSQIWNGVTTAYTRVCLWTWGHTYISLVWDLWWQVV